MVCQNLLDKKQKNKLNFRKNIYTNKKPKYTTIIKFKQKRN